MKNLTVYTKYYSVKYENHSKNIVVDFKQFCGRSNESTCSFENINCKNTSLAAMDALAHKLQNQKTLKMAQH